MQHGVYIFINFECLRLWHARTEREPTNDTTGLPSHIATHIRVTVVDNNKHLATVVVTL